MFKNVLILFYACFTTMTYAQSPLARDAEKTGTYLAYLNRPSFIEPAGSLGSFGWPSGLGVHQYQAITDNALAQTVLQTQAQDTIYAPTLFIAKGTSWPVDLGFSFSTLQGSDAQRMSAFLQITVLEDFGIPAISLRAFHSSLMGLGACDASGQALEVIASQGFMRFFNVFVSARAERQAISFELSESEYYGLSAANEPFAYHENLQTYSAAAGTKMIIGPTSNINVEWSKDLHHYSSVAAKLALLL